VDIKTFILDLAKFLGPGLFVLVVVLAVILLVFLLYTFKRSTIALKYEPGKGFTFIKVEPPEKPAVGSFREVLGIEELKLTNQETSDAVITNKTKKSKQVK
jgi:hypothetical protein